MSQVPRFTFEHYENLIQKWRTDALAYRRCALESFRGIWDLIVCNQEVISTAELAEISVSLSKLRIFQT